jgi:8-oxo-dGTP diphosphatase
MRERRTVRGLLLDATGALLLQAVVDPHVHRPGQAAHTTPVWIVPGGGVRPGEGDEAALAREFDEETGLAGITWGAWLWRREVILQWQGAPHRFIEHYRIGRIDAVAPAVHDRGWEAHERSVIRASVWWNLSEFASRGDIVYPPRLRAGPSALPRNATAPAFGDVSDAGEISDISAEG